MIQMVPQGAAPSFLPADVWKCMVQVDGCVSLVHSCWDSGASGDSAVWLGSSRHSTGSVPRVQRNSLCSDELSQDLQSRHDSGLTLKCTLLVNGGSLGRRYWVWSARLGTVVAAQVLDFPPVRFLVFYPQYYNWGRFAKLPQAGRELTFTDGVCSMTVLKYLLLKSWARLRSLNSLLKLEFSENYTQSRITVALLPEQSITSMAQAHLVT